MQTWYAHKDDAISNLFHHNKALIINNFALSLTDSRVAQWKRAGPITQRSEDQNLALLRWFFSLTFFLFHFSFGPRMY